jgi:hypothetical protein
MLHFVTYLILKPRLDDAFRVGVLVRQEDHSHPGDRRRRGVRQVVRLEQEVDVGSELRLIGKCLLYSDIVDLMIFKHYTKYNG